MGTWLQAIRRLISAPGPVNLRRITAGMEPPAAAAGLAGLGALKDQGNEHFKRQEWRQAFKVRPHPAVHGCGVQVCAQVCTHVRMWVEAGTLVLQAAPAERFNCTPSAAGERFPTTAFLQPPPPGGAGVHAGHRRRPGPAGGRP